MSNIRPGVVNGLLNLGSQPLVIGGGMLLVGRIVFARIEPTYRDANIAQHVQRAQVEGLVSHNRLKQISTEHAADLTKMLGNLVREGLLYPDGVGRGMVYYLPWQKTQELELLFERSDQTFIPPKLRSIPPELPPVPPELPPIPPELSPIPPELITRVSLPIFLAWNDIPDSEKTILLEIAAPVRDTGRVRPEILRQTIGLLCTGRYLGRNVLAHILQRDADDLRKRTLRLLVQTGQLKQAYASSRDPRQAYITSNNLADQA